MNLHRWSRRSIFVLPAIATLVLPGVRLGAAEPALDPSALDYHYRVFSDTCYLAPTPMQTQTLERAEAIYDLLHGYRATPPGPAEFDHVSAATRAHLADLERVYPRRTLVWDGAAMTLRESEPLALTAQLPALVLGVFVNESTQTLLVEAFVDDGVSPHRGRVGVAPGASLPYLLPVTLGDAAATELPLVVLVGEEGTSVHRLTLPVRASKPVRVRGVTLDAATGQPFPARVYARGADHILRHGVEYADNRTLSEKSVVFRPAMIKLPFFYSDGEFEIDLPPGRTTFTLERGYETPLETVVVELSPGDDPTSVTLSGKRLVDMASRGWYSGDTHIHWAINSWDQNEDIDLLAMVQRAEDLRVANNLTLYQWRPDDQGGPFVKPDQYPMGPVAHLSDEHYHIQMGEEYRNDNHYGHINLLNIKELIQPIAAGPGSGGPPTAFDYPLNKTIIEEAHRQGGISIEAHNLGPFHASGVPVNLVHGLSDSMDQLDPAHYYNFLNAGLRVGLSNGSDHPARVTGVCRVYVHLDGGFSYQAWCDSLAAGRTFTTSGPLLLFTVNDQQPGAELDLAADTPLTATVEAISRHPLGTVQIVSNGEVIAETRTQELRATLTTQLALDRPRWFVARASQTTVYDALMAPNVAHTSAIYVDRDGHSVFDPRAAQVWIDNIKMHRQRLVERGNFEKPEHRQEALDYIDSGIALFEARIRDHIAASP